MKLLFGPASPFVRKVRITAHEHELTEGMEIVLIDQMTLDSPIWECNPLGKLPALVLPNGEVLFDSPVICEYLDSVGNGPRLFPATAPARWRALGLQALGDGIMDAIVARTLELRRGPDQQSPYWLDRYEMVIGCAADLLKRHVSWLHQSLTIDHIAVACGLGHIDFRNPERQWRERRPALTEWFQRFSLRPSMMATTPRNRA